MAPRQSRRLKHQTASRLAGTNFNRRSQAEIHLRLIPGLTFHPPDSPRLARLEFLHITLYRLVGIGKAAFNTEILIDALRAQARFSCSRWLLHTRRTCFADLPSAAIRSPLASRPALSLASQPPAFTEGHRCQIEAFVFKSANQGLPPCVGRQGTGSGADRPWPDARCRRVLPYWLPRSPWKIVRPTGRVLRT